MSDEYQESEESQEEESGSPLDDREDLQKLLLDRIRSTNEKGKANRLGEVQNARDARLYYRDYQQFYWSEDRQDIVLVDDDDDNEPYSRTFNVFQGYGKIFQSTFMGARPKVRPEADDPFDSVSIRNTAKAEQYERVYRKHNDTPTQQLEIARLLWTDSRVVTRTTQRQGREVTEFFGVLESRLPVAAKRDIEVPLANCNIIQLEDEFATATMKADYPDARDKISSGRGDGYDRNARMAVKRTAGTDTALDVMTGEDSYGMATKTWTYLRPVFFEDFKESERQELAEMFENGLCIVHTGDVYLESYECDIDSTLDVIFALPGDGMSGPSIGQTAMTLQDAANTGQNLIEEMFDHGIPTTYADQAANIAGLNKQREMPGQTRWYTGKAGMSGKDLFFETTPVQPSAALIEYVDNVKGPQMQFATAMQPALNGAEMQDQKTASGYAQARSMALGVMAIVWKPYTSWNAREMTRAVKMASKGKDEIVAVLKSDRAGGRNEAIRLSPGDLGGVGFSNESDENFPETFTERQNKFMQLIQMGGNISDMILERKPENIYLLKQMTQLDGLVFPGEDIYENALEDIASLEKDPSLPDPSQMPSAMFPQPGQTPQVPTIPGIQIDTEFLDPDDYKTGYETVKDWMYSAKGKQVKLSDPGWYERVRQYGLQYKQGMQAAQQAAQAPPPVKPMNISANWADLPPDAQAQALLTDQIHANPQTIGVNKKVVPTKGA